MTDEQIFSKAGAADMPVITILSDGQNVNEKCQIVSVVITRSVNEIPTAVMTLKENALSADSTLTHTSRLFSPGKMLEIQMGTPAEPETLFKGLIIDHGIKVRKNSSPVQVIKCKDRVVQMTGGRRSACYRNMRDSEMIDAILQKYGLTARIEPTGFKHSEMLKYNLNDWHVVVSLARKNGKAVLVHDGEVVIQSPEAPVEPSLILQQGVDFSEFDAAIASAEEMMGIQADTWDYTNQEIRRVCSEPAAVEQHNNVYHADVREAASEKPAKVLKYPGLRTAEELRERIAAEMIWGEMSRITGRLKCPGFLRVMPGDWIGLKGVGELFEGNSWISGVKHSLKSGCWETAIRFGLTADNEKNIPQTMLSPSSGELLPTVQGLQIGVVSQFEEDPEGEARILVKLPMVDAGDSGVWARLVTPDAGKNRGFFFRPDIGDEVVLGFLDNNSRDPIVLGMLHSSARPTPLPVTAENDEKGLVTRSGMKVIFNDAAHEIRIGMPDGSYLSIGNNADGISLEDQNGNLVTMAAEGISLESGSNIRLKALGEIEMEGTNIVLKAGRILKAQGAAGAELSSNAVTIVKGDRLQLD